MSPLKTVFVLPSLESGGAERVLITLINHADRKKYSPALIIMNNKGPLSALVAADIQVLALGHAGPLPFGFFKLFKTLRALRPDMVISTVTPMNFVTLLTRPFFPKTRYIVREATMPSFFLKKFSRYKPAIWLMFQLYRLADAIICPAQGMMRELQEIYRLKNTRFFWLPNPVNTAAIEIALQKEVPSRKADREFVSVGRLVYEKGYDRLIPALRHFSPGWSWHFSIVGDGPELQRLEALIVENNLRKNITLTGFTDNPWLYVARADMFLLPSRLEGLPNVVLESLACGTPVIAMKEAGGIAEIAALTSPEELRIAATIDEMTALMENVNRKSNRATRLPDQYRLENVDKRFGLFLDRLTGNQGFEDL